MEDLSHLPDDERKKALRRLRNKEAAARCRKRRLDQTVSLEDQVADWEAKVNQMRREITSLSAEESELRALLEAHKQSCQFRSQQLDTAPLSDSSSKKSKINNNTS